MCSGFKQSACLLVMGVLTILGCSGGGGSTATSAPAAPALLPNVPQTPEAAVNTVLDGLKGSKPLVLWDAMAAQQQGNLNNLVRQLAGSIDPEVWQHSVDNLRKLTQLLETKKDLILASPMLKMSKDIKPDQLKANWGPFVALLKTVVDSELVDQSKMKNFDGRAFFEGTGAKLYPHLRELAKSMKNDPFKRIADLKATVTSSTERTAKIALTSSDPKAKPVELNLSISDGKWVADEFGMLYTALILQEARFAAHFRPYELVEWKDDYLKSMDRVGKALDGLQAAKTPADFQAVASQQVLPLLLQTMARLNQKPKPQTDLQLLGFGRGKDTAMVLIPGEHFADEPPMAALTQTFRAWTQERHGLMSGPNPVQGTVAYLVSPVTDINELAKKIGIGKVTRTDVKRNTLTLELPSEAGSGKSAANADAPKSGDAAK